MIGGIGFAYYEYEEYKALGFKDYFDGIWNKIDTICLIVYWLFVICHIISEDYNQWWHIYLRIFLVGTVFIKLNFFARIHEEMGLLVNLLITCLEDIIPFSSYLFLWLFGFYLFYKQSGITAPSGHEA